MAERVEDRKSSHAATHLTSTPPCAICRMGSEIKKQHNILASSFPQISYKYIVLMLERAAQMQA